MVYCAVVGCTNNNNKKVKTIRLATDTFASQLPRKLAIYGCRSASKSTVLILQMREYAQIIFRMMIFVPEKTFATSQK